MCQVEGFKYPRFSITDICEESASFKIMLTKYPCSDHHSIVESICVLIVHVVSRSPIHGTRPAPDIYPVARINGKHQSFLHQSAVRKTLHLGSCCSTKQRTLSSKIYIHSFWVVEVRGIPLAIGNGMTNRAHPWHRKQEGRKRKSEERRRRHAII